MITRLAVAGYRSLRDLGVELAPLALRLLAANAQGRAVSPLTLEGGLSSTLWAGPEMFSREHGTRPVQGLVGKEPVSLTSWTWPQR